MARETAASAIQSGHIIAQVGICAFDGVSLLFAGQNVVKSHSLARSVDQFAVSDQAIAEELSDVFDQSKSCVYQRLQGLVSALFDHIKSYKRPRFAVDEGG